MAKKEKLARKHKLIKVRKYPDGDLLDRIKRLQEEGHDESLVHLRHLLTEARLRGLQVPTMPPRPSRIPKISSTRDEIHDYSSSGERREPHSSSRPWWM
jgi:hypothetical protein